MENRAYDGAPKPDMCRNTLGAFAVVAVFAVAALAGLAELRGGAIASVGLVQVHADEFGTIELIFLSPKDVGDATGKPRKNLHLAIIDDKRFENKNGKIQFRTRGKSSKRLAGTLALPPVAITRRSGFVGFTENFAAGDEVEERDENCERY